MHDVLIVGAGPAGAIAGLVLARAGARVRIIDRASFPRDKLCGDTVNPGTLARLRRLGVADEIDRRGLRVDGMIVTGGRGVTIEGRYPRGGTGRALLRRDLDAILLDAATAAGCAFESGITARGAIVDEGSVRGADTDRGPMRAPVTIAADGRRSAVAWGLGVARHPQRPRRWAVGGYFEGTEEGRRRDGGGTEATPSPVVGEMHVRRNCYIGVAPVPQGLTNVCVVRPSGPADHELADAAALLTRTLAADPMLRDRFADARLVAPPVVLGPLAVDVDARAAAIPGLLLAGDAAGFIDPMTGDGLRFAVQGGELAAAAALRALEHGWTGVHGRLEDDRRRAFGGKWRFNRALRTLVASPRGVEAAALGARVAPAVMRAVIARAGDCNLQSQVASPDSRGHR